MSLDPNNTPDPTFLEALATAVAASETQFTHQVQEFGSTDDDAVYKLRTVAGQDVWDAYQAGLLLRENRIITATDAFLKTEAGAQLVTEGPTDGID